jgi:hypothetical protein
LTDGLALVLSTEAVSFEDFADLLERRLINQSG